MRLLGFGRSLLLSLPISVVIPATLLYALDYVTVGAGVGGPFDFPDTPLELGLCFGFAMLAFPFLMATVLAGLPITALMRAAGIPEAAEIIEPVRHGALTIEVHTVLAGVIGLIVQVIFWAIIIHGIAYLRWLASSKSSLNT